MTQEPPTRRKGSLGRRLALAAATTAAVLAVTEAGFRWRAARRTEPAGPRLHVALPDRPYLFGLDPAHPEVSSQGLRDREYACPCPLDVRRVLLLGDSVVYGPEVPLEAVLARRLELELAPHVSAPGGLQVVNAGVNAWSPYNERAWYEAEGWRFGAELVVLVLCLNDVANPYRHWQFVAPVLPQVPVEAVPHPSFRAGWLAEQARGPGWAARAGRFLESHSDLARWVGRTLRAARDRRAGAARLAATTIRGEGRTWPGHLTGEDAVSIQVLMDAASPPFRWLVQQVARLDAAVRGQGARLAVVIVPLAYQLDPAYPYLPQTLLVPAIEALGVPCVSLLPALRARPAADVFLGELSGYQDVWHLTVTGHALAAAELAKFLVARDLVPE